MILSIIVITEMINDKMAEHQIEIDGCKKFIQENKPGKITKQDSEQMKKMQQLLIMKDKLLFHQAAFKVLEDFKKDIEQLDGEPDSILLDENNKVK